MRLLSDPPSATLDAFPGPMAAYRAKRAAGELKPDPMQELAAEKLQMLHRALLHYTPQPPAAPGGWRAILGLVPSAPPRPKPKGLYIFGGVGRGKSMLMDLFFAASSVRAKRRVHFHAFMQEVHDRLHRLRASNDGEPVQKLAADIAAGATLLCFDELQVKDIADAMIIGRLFEALLSLGTIVVATSNRAPDELYKDGLQRERFLPFIEMLKQELDVLELDNGRDYRLSRLIGRPVYYTPDDAAARQALEEIFTELTDGSRPEPMVIEVKKREVRVPRQAHGAAWFEFNDLCGTPLGAVDYLAIAERFESVVIAGVPMLTPAMRNEAVRFNTLIDTLYEAKTRTIISAAAAPQTLYPEGDGSFEFQRTVSRLMEMQSAEYLSSRHCPDAPKAHT
ncbi:MAG TPA: cell division protein ZapE [Aliidongia sp.]|nr:cell division protein ZapE [Aliidongia sp.]